jgi:hypothetical protein
MSRETEAWIRDWEQRRTALLDLLRRIEGGDMKEATAVLRKVRDLRESWTEPSHPELRLLAQRLLDAVWEAARASLYGDLEASREHAASAGRHMREVQIFLSSRSSS